MPPDKPSPHPYDASPHPEAERRGHAPADLPLGQRPAIGWRSVTLGVLGVLVICGLSPYNNYALNNTFLVGNSLPLGVVTMAFLLAVFVNGPLSRWAPRAAFTSGELAVALAMTLVSCTLPGAGLMRYFPPSLVSPFWHARGDQPFLNAVESLDLPRWLFPSFEGATPSEWMRDPIVTGYLGRWLEAGPFPYAQWAVPLLAWGVLLGAFYASFLFLVAILHRQWFENERLPFPLATVHLALVTQPTAGRWFNDVLSTRGFWIAFAAAFGVHVWNGLGLYFPLVVPTIPLRFDLNSVFSEQPFNYIDGQVKSATIYLTIVGVTYFLSSAVAIGLWGTFLLVNVGLKMAWGIGGAETDYVSRYDQHFGAVLALFATVLWIGRRHWLLVLRQAIRGRRAGEPQGRYMSYRAAGIGFAICIGLMVVWLVAAGCTLVVAVTTVGMLMMLMIVITRVVAETGLAYSGLQVTLTKPFTMLASAADPHPVPLKSFYLASTIDAHHYDMREVAPVYITHAAKVADATAAHAASNADEDDVALAASRRFYRRLLGLMALAIALGYVVSAWSTLWTEYTFAATLDTKAVSPINDWGARDQPRGFIVEAVTRYAAPAPPPTQRSVTLHVAIGFAITAALAAMRLRFVAWPIHPIGFVLLAPPPLARVWFSVFLGWLIKMMITRFGGSSLYGLARPFFIGLIVGESVAAGTWLIVALVLNASGLPFHAYFISPT